MKFKAGDKITVPATVVSTNTPYGWIGVEFPSGGFGTIEQADLDAELIERPKTPGQRAFEASFDKDEVHITWGHQPMSVQARWERIARAVTS